MNETSLVKTPLNQLHRSLGGKMVPFAGYEMAVSYPLGILKEHLHVRSHVGLFDIGHMGVMELQSQDDDALVGALETMVPGDIAGLQPGQMRYTVLLNEAGGIEDDLIVTRLPQMGDTYRLGLVVNAARKTHDLTYMADHLPQTVQLVNQPHLALLALQGPLAKTIMERVWKEALSLGFMEAVDGTIDGMDVRISRCGYTGEDGFEFCIDQSNLLALAKRLLSFEEVEMIGLGARDSLRLEAGLSLYGHDLDTGTSPIEAGLSWVVSKKRRSLDEAGFLGRDVILNQLVQGAPRRLIALTSKERLPAREGAKIFLEDGTHIGNVTSGGFSPSLGHPIAMGYVDRAKLGDETNLLLEVRGKTYPWQRGKLPFVPHNYVR